MSALPNLPEDLVNVSKTKTEDDDAHITVADPPPATSRERVDSVVSDSHLTRGLNDSPVENFRPVKVIVIGAGYSGIYLGIRIPEKIRNCELVIYEKNDGVGGTWWENRYPGCACDIPSPSYQYSFNPNLNWSSLYAPAPEIQAYLESTAKKYSADRFIKLSHEITECRWDENEGKWHVKVNDRKSGTTFEDTSDILVSARGALNSMRWPSIEGLSDFQGEKMHSAKWDQTYDFSNKRIGVIGSGSSAIQIVPQLQRAPNAQLSCFIRSPTWISPPFGQDVWDKLGLTGYEITDSLKEKFKADPKAYQEFRLTIEESGNSIHGATIDGHRIQKEGQEMFTKHMTEKLQPTHQHILEKLLPSFSPGCRRLTPGIGFLEALKEPNVSFISSEITRVEKSGVRTADGNLHEIDVLCCATGFHAATAPPFPIVGQKGQTVSQQWADAGRPTSYLSLALAHFPNHFVMLGPNSAIGSGSLTMMIESVGDYIVKCVRKIQKDNIRSMAPKPARVDDFMAYADAYFAGTVFAQECRSWYKNGSRDGKKVTGLWPGSTQHCIEVMRSPRWEDWDYEYVGEEDGREGNRMAWLGNGWSINQLEDHDLAWYLYPEFVDTPLEGKPEDNKIYKIRPFSY